LSDRHHGSMTARFARGRRIAIMPARCLPHRLMRGRRSHLVFRHKEGRQRRDITPDIIASV
jgi:hypothetical protein